MLEEEVAVGRVARYGMATWSGFRAEAGAREHLSLEEIVAIAREVGGSRHGFRAVQLPLNLAMTEALTARTQGLASRGELLAPLLEVAGELGVSVFASGSILQGRLASGLPSLLVETFPGLASDAQRALQFTRSTPGVTTALVGMKQRRHVDENLALAAHPPASLEDLLRLFETDRSETTA
jgi:predicted aldo/keto reductase-like oxidoreductase